jgi:hypothetical protein
MLTLIAVNITVSHVNHRKFCRGWSLAAGSGDDIALVTVITFI